MENQLFNLKFTAKTLQRQSRKCEKNEKSEKLKLKKAIEKGNVEGARIYAQNAIREKNQALNLLRLSSRIEAVASRLNQALAMKQVTRSMASITKQLDKAMQSMNLEAISQTMEKFEKSLEDVDVSSSVIEETMSSTTTLTTPQDQVDSLISQVADEHNLDVADKLGIAVPKTAAAEGQKEETLESDADDLSSRLAALKS